MLALLLMNLQVILNKLFIFSVSSSVNYKIRLSKFFQLFTTNYLRLL
uniref:Macaca fascicularis brain cDNA clone: QflA-20428, similar to human FYN binding protein (FYB-120/130) (FYB), mRNA, RefSeq: NM_001465.3 n=1 Tax=Macaca fascicularis TaxID=9541 RepID=I7G6K1_MACFA|nr:unnamed protein product [Macaca fascicularis]